MHKYPQYQSYVGSNGQTLTTNVSMTLCSWQMCHQTHVLCVHITFLPNQIRYQINTPAVAWTRAQLIQGGGGHDDHVKIFFLAQNLFFWHGIFFFSAEYFFLC